MWVDKSQYLVSTKRGNGEDVRGMTMNSEVPLKPMHVADIDFVEMFRPAFPSTEKVTDFVKHVENLPRDNTKVVLHQAGRMVWLADRMDEVAHGRPALQILFFIIAAEAVSKMVFQFNGESQSKNYVRRFFGEVCSDKHRDCLGRAFWWWPNLDAKRGRSLSWKETADILYEIRCDVAHRGVYYNVHLKYPTDSPDSHTLLRWKGKSLSCRISVDEIRQIILEGAVSGCRKLLESRGKAG